MPRRLKSVFVALLFPVLAGAAVWPETAGTWRRVSAGAARVSDRALWDEYGLQEAETARFEAGEKKFTATAWRFQDATGAMAAFEWQRPADARPSRVAELAVETASGVLLAFGNYVISFEDYRPAAEEVSAVLGALPRLYQQPLPSLPGFFPDQNKVANSERYVVGPVGLARFENRIPPSAAGFHFGTEARIADFQSPGGPMRLALFNYPTPQIAMQQYEALTKIPGAMVKRSGPLVAVVVSPPDADAAERLLALVRYNASVTMHEYVPTRRDNIAHLILTIFELTGLLLLFALVAGLAVGGVRAAIRRMMPGQEGDPMILLNLSDRGNAPGVGKPE